MLGAYKASGAFFLLTILLSVGALAGKYELDGSHTEVGFSVKHLMITNVKGRFQQAKGSFEFDTKTQAIKNVDIEIEAASVNTGDKKRDEHLVGADFFDVKKYPKITFKSNGIVLKNKQGDLVGKLSMHGKTKDVTFKVNYNGAASFMGVERVSFTAETVIARKDFDIVWNKNLDGGGIAVGEDVKVSIEGEAIPK